MPPAKLNILQTNLGRCRAAHDLAYFKARRDGIDIMVVAEPNIRITATGWYRDLRKDVAVIMLNKGVQVQETKAGRGYVGLTLRDMSLFYGYISTNVALPTFEADLDDLFADVRNVARNSMVVGDFNAKAQAWGSPITDRRGELLGWLLSTWQSLMTVEHLRA